VSPIEARLLDAVRRLALSENIHLSDYTPFTSMATMDGDTWLVDVREHEPDVETFGQDLGHDRVEQWSIYSDVPLLSYRADFAVRSEYGLVIVECDGHDWHDRTKQQAAYDRARDRELLLTGLVTVRYTGSEIHHSAERCAREVIRIARMLGDKSLKEWRGSR
jgi:very-short-patch-repair endonuclease